jgi:hypothetical protein
MGNKSFEYTGQFSGIFGNEIRKKAEIKMLIMSL